MNSWEVWFFIALCFGISIFFQEKVRLEQKLNRIEMLLTEMKEVRQ